MKLEIGNLCSSKNYRQRRRRCTTVPPPDTVAVWKVVFKLDTAIDRSIHRLNFWIQAVVRIGPCLVLTVLSALLVRTMRRADARLRSMESGSTPQRIRRQRATNRTTRMLLAIVILFLITELPQGVVMIRTIMNKQNEILTRKK